MPVERKQVILPEAHEGRRGLNSYRRILMKLATFARGIDGRFGQLAKLLERGVEIFRLSGSVNDFARAADRRIRFGLERRGALGLLSVNPLNQGVVRL